MDVTSLDFGDLNLTGAIPETLASLPSLELLSLRNNRFGGRIPESIFGLSNLVQLDLHGNQLANLIPQNIGSLQKLEILALGNNSFSGTLPPSITSLTRLAVLSVENNRLQGSLPDNIGEMKNLTRISVAYNQLSGEIPASITTLPKLKILHLESNNFYGSIPSGIASMGLDEFKFEDNCLSGTWNGATLTQEANCTFIDNAGGSTQVQLDNAPPKDYGWIYATIGGAVGFLALVGGAFLYRRYRMRKASGFEKSNFEVFGSGNPNSADGLPTATKDVRLVGEDGTGLEAGPRGVGDREADFRLPSRSTTQATSNTFQTFGGPGSSLPPPMPALTSSDANSSVGPLSRATTSTTAVAQSTLSSSRLPSERSTSFRVLNLPENATTGYTEQSVDGSLSRESTLVQPTRPSMDFDVPPVPPVEKSIAHYNATGSPTQLFNFTNSIQVPRVSTNPPIPHTTNEEAKVEPPQMLSPPTLKTLKKMHSLLSSATHPLTWSSAELIAYVATLRLSASLTSMINEHHLEGKHLGELRDHWVLREVVGVRSFGVREEWLGLVRKLEGEFGSFGSLRVAGGDRVRSNITGEAAEGDEGLPGYETAVLGTV
ncbi:hypothetical protein HDV05_004342 [Chytridiales sp. JEL 0842]|nr:hypothetical protein HDV05_004342 [Chytridiales sp. JEL 0842]